MNSPSIGWWIVAVCLLLCSNVVAQDTLYADSMREVVVSALQTDAVQQTSVHIDPLPLESAQNTAVFNATDAVAQLPGVSQLSTGPAISKPSIRGLYGNRILVLVAGMRFDNQQWQDEHGLGLSDIGLSRIEVIKGPLSILHGSEAMGGVLNLVPERKSEVGQQTVDAGIRFQSNTRGPLLHLGYRSNKGKRWLGARMGAETHADYSDGQASRVLNSRFQGGYGMLRFGFVRKKWLCDNHYYFSLTRSGFIFSDVRQFIEPDARWSNAMIGPHHIVQLHLLSSENTFRVGKSKLEANFGMQSNYRSENEGGARLTLQMHLISALGSIRWSRSLSKRSTLVLASNSSLENNTNYGSRKIVPDACMKESSLSGYMRHKLGTVLLEYGAGAGLRHIKTLITSRVNSEEKDIDPFSQLRYFANAMAGASWNPNQFWNVKLNTATGVRAPNLAELSSNGLHEGIFTYEIGNPNLRNEFNINTDLTATRNGKQVELMASAFYNDFHNYIYLRPNGGEWFGFPVYEFVQDDALLTGGEARLGYRPTWLKPLHVSGTYSGLIGRLRAGSYLPFMPAQQWHPRIEYDWKHARSGVETTLFCSMQLVAKQSLTGDLEATTPAYQLLNAGVHVRLKSDKANYVLAVTGRNLLNQAYYDHLSRLKAFELLNMGRNIIFQFNIQFKHHKHDNF